MKKLFLLLMAVMLTTTYALAQNVTISGTVVDAENDEPLIGASVQPVGSSTGVATDIDGNFTLSIPASVKEISVSYVGYTTVKLPVQPVMTVKMQTSNQNLDVLVVTGYGSARKLGSVVGSVAVVGDAVLENNPSANFVDALSGQVAGMTLSSNTGEPSSSETDIRIRGVNSLNASTAPLFVLDGAPVNSSVFTSLSPSVIESVTVLKDASATAIYGSRAANGVVVITTKKGKFGEQAQVTVRANVGWSGRVQSKIDMMDSNQYLSFRQTMAETFGVEDVSDEVKNLVKNYGISTDWQKEMMKDNALYYSLEGAVQGGSENSSYYISLGHLDQDGIIAKSGFRRETLRGSIDTRIKPWLKVGLQTNLSYSKYETNSIAAEAGRFYMNGPIVLSYMMLPYESPYYYTFDENGKIVYGERANWYKYTTNGIADANFVNALNHGSRSSLNIDAMLYEQLNPIKGLTLRAQQAVTAFDYRNTQDQLAVEDYVTPMGDVTEFGQYTDRLRGESFQRMYQFTYTNTAEYMRTIGVHDFSALVGQESIIYRVNQFNVSTTGQPNNMLTLLTNGTDVQLDDVGQSISEYIMNSYFLNLHYSYDNRYFFDGSIRRDGSSKFAPGHRWSTFYALGAMWNIKNEAFMNGTTWLDDLKLRVNYGTTGNSGISPYMYMGTVSTGNPYNGENTLGISGQSNDDLTWETVKQFDLGLSYSVLNRRLYGDIDFYVKNTEDMLMNVPYSYTTGFSSGWSNMGSMRNIGVDFEIGSKVYQDRDWFVGLRANFNYNKNTITELFNGQTEYRMNDTGMVYIVGENPFQLNTVRYAGVDPQDGKQLWYDVNGNLTKEFNHDRDAVNTGKSFIAPWNGGFGIDVSWKGLSLRSDWTWAAEKYIFNWAGQLICNPSYMYDMNQDVRMLNSWTHPGQITDMPAITEEIQPDSRYLENSSYLRMKNITLTYTLPKSFVERLYMSNIALHFTGRNLLTFSADSYTGNDPEYENNGVRFNYPNTRQYEFGIEVSF